MAQAVGRANLGAWLLKCNPHLWDLRAFIASGESRITSWAVQRNYRSDLMARADRVLFWVSGSGSSGLARGIWGAGHVVAPAEDWNDDEPGFWIHDQPRRAVRGRVPVDIALFDEPVTVTDLRARGITDLEVQKIPQGANPSWLTKPQLAALDELLP